MHLAGEQLSCTCGVVLPLVAMHLAGDDPESQTTLNISVICPHNIMCGPESQRNPCTADCWFNKI